MAGSEIVLSSLRQTQEIADEAAKRLARTLDKLEKQLIALVPIAPMERTVDLALATSNVQRLLRESGYFEEVGVLLGPDYQKAINISHAQYRQMFNQSFRFQPESIEILNAFKQSDLKEFSKIGLNLADTLADGIVDFNFGAISRKELFGIVFENATEKAKQFAGTWANTGLAGFYNEANVSLAEDSGFNIFEYVGVINPNSRPYCRKYIGQKKTREGWEKTANDPIRGKQPLPVVKFLGGFRCIHTLVAIEPDEIVISGEETLEQQYENIRNTRFPGGFDDTGLAYSEKDIIKNLTGRDMERGFILDRDGNVLVIDGERSRLTYTARDGQLMSGAKIHIHNHPDSNHSFSPSDIFTSSKFNYEEALVVSKNNNFRAVRTGDSWIPEGFTNETFRQTIESIERNVVFDLSIAVEKGEITREFAEENAQDLIWKEASKFLNFKYSKESK
jgi:hypothetical protein